KELNLNEKCCDNTSNVAPFTIENECPMCNCSPSPPGSLPETTANPWTVPSQQQHRVSSGQESVHIRNSNNNKPIGKAEGGNLRKKAMLQRKSQTCKCREEGKSPT
ncbi:unnamed protein product, partial [Owenia fusiformis]